MFSTLFIDIRLVVSIQTNHTCHITSTQLRDLFFYLNGFFPHWAYADSSFMGTSVVSCLDMNRYLCTVRWYLWRVRPRSDARRVREPDCWVSSDMTDTLRHSTSYSWTYSWSSSWSCSWTYVFRIKTMTSLILNPVVMDYFYLGINTWEKDMFLELSKDKIMIVLELS